MKQNKIPRNEYIVKPKGKTDPYKDDVQYTNLGQWKYPGQVTKIPSNDITMQGVNYPVYGEDDLGYGQMMYPGMDYTFPGQYVTETPMAQYGKQFNTYEADLISKVLMNRNRDKDFVQRAYALGQNPNMFSVPDPDQFGSNMSHKMEWGEDDSGQAWMYPSIMNPKNEAIKVPNQYADYISSEGYKKATGMPVEKNGGWLDEYQVGGPRFGDLRPTSDATRVVIPNLPKKALTKKEKQEVKQYEIKQAARDLEKAQKTVDKINRIKAANKAQAEQGFPNTRQEWADQTQAIGDKLSLQNLPVVGKYIPDMLDVTGGIGQMASNLGSAPLRAQQENSYLPYVTAIGEPLLTGALAGINAKPTGLFTNDKKIPDFFTANDAIEYFKNLGQGTKELIKNIPKTVKYSFDNYKELQKLPGQYKNAIKDLTNPEALKRLKNLGVEDTDDFINFINNVKINATTEGSHFFPIGPGSVNINPGQLKELKKTMIPLASQESGIDHELGHAIQYYLENKGKTFNRLTDLDIEAVDELSPHLTENVSNFLKNTTGKDYKSAKEAAKDLGELSSNYLFRNKREPLAHLRETKRSMVDKGIINNINETITPEHIQEFILKGGNEDRILSTLQQTPEARKSLSGLLNRTPAVIPVGTGILGASKLQQEQNGGWLDNYEDEFKKGGQKGLKRFTSKNIQTSINDIMLRNETIYGPSGKRRYKPNLKYQDGGESTNWLDDI